jgi:peptide/nickel transport system permease protein
VTAAAIQMARAKRSWNLELTAGLLILLVVVLAALLAPALAPFPPTRINLAVVRKPPSLQHLFGTDGVGRDVLSRVLHGGRVSLLVSTAGMCGSLLLGTAMGLLGALADRVVRWAVDRLIDVQLAFPYVLLAIAITSVAQPSIPVLILLMVLAGWAGAARVVRGVGLQERGKDYVKAATVVGVPKLRIALRHVLPSIIPSIQVLAAMQMAAMIVFEATLSFLGMGIQPPRPSWGGIMLDGKDYLTDAWWLTALPGLAIVVTSLSLVLIGDGLQQRASLRSQQTVSAP